MHSNVVLCDAAMSLETLLSYSLFLFCVGTVNLRFMLTSCDLKVIFLLLFLYLRPEYKDVSSTIFFFKPNTYDTAQKVAISEEEKECSFFPSFPKMFFILAFRWKKRQHLHDILGKFDLSVKQKKLFYLNRENSNKGRFHQNLCSKRKCTMWWSQKSLPSATCRCTWSGTHGRRAELGD